MMPGSLITSLQLFILTISALENFQSSFFFHLKSQLASELSRDVRDNSGQINHLQHGFSVRKTFLIYPSAIPPAILCMPSSSIVSRIFNGPVKLLNPFTSNLHTSFAQTSSRIVALDEVFMKSVFCSLAIYFLISKCTLWYRSKSV